MSESNTPIVQSVSKETPSKISGPPIKGQAGVVSYVPFGLGKVKPNHFLEMGGVLWENRDNLQYAWNILNHGVCDGCSLGTTGMRDHVLEGTHLCMSRLKLLRNNTIGAFSESDVVDMAQLRKKSNTELREMGRIPYPFVYKTGDRGFTRVSWDRALALIGERLSKIEPDRQGYFATSKGITNETYYMFTKMARLMGTNNVDFCARLCHAATVSGLSTSIGVGAPTISLSDLIGTDLVLLWGTNLANNQPVSVKYLHHAKKAGTRIVSINTVREKGLEEYWIPSIPESALFGSKLADEWVQVKIGGDLALMMAILKRLVEWDAVNHSFIEQNTKGFAELSSAVSGLSMEELSEHSGVSMSKIDWLATMIARAKSMVTVYSMGLTQHTFGTENVWGVVNLHLAKGAIGKEKSGILPIRGHSGVQGGGECGVVPTKYPGGFKVTEENAQRFTDLWGHEVPHSKGMDTGRMLEAAHRGELDFLYNLGGNLHHTMPDTDYIEEAFKKVGLRIHQDINLNTSTLIEPGEMIVLLPAQTRYEQRGGGTSTSTERRIRFSPEIPGHPTIGESKPEYEIPALVAVSAKPELKEALLLGSSQAIRDEMAAVMPVYHRINELQSEGDEWQWGGPQLCANGNFSGMPDGLGQFHIPQIPNTTLPTGWYKMTTRRGKQFNSMVFNEADTLQGGKRRDDIFLSMEDALELGVADGAALELQNEMGTFRGVARPVEMARGALQTYWPETNMLIERKYDEASGEPDYNCLVQIRPL